MSLNRQHRLQRSHAAARLLVDHGVSEVTPSRRDFAQFVATQKTELAVLARLSGAREMVIAQARACDDAEVAALLIESGPDGLSSEDMVAIADATGAPLLSDLPLLETSQLYDARLHGADAALLPAAELGTAALGELIAVARSLHMAPVVEVQSRADVELAVALPHVIIALYCVGLDDALDVARTVELAQQIPPARTVIVLPAVRDSSTCAALRTHVDAITIAAAQLQPDVPAALRAMLG